MNELVPGYYGIMAERTKDTDWQLGGDLILPNPPHTFEQNKIQYHQPEVSPVSCTLHGVLGAISDLTGYTYKLEERKQLWAKAVSLGANDVGWYIHLAKELGRKDWNDKNPNNKIVAFEVNLGSEKFFNAIDKGYAVVVGHRYNLAYNNDYRSDKKLDGVSFGEFVGGHCDRMNRKDDKTLNITVDNYSAGTNNIYEVPRANIQALVNNGVYFKVGYIFVFAKDVDAINAPSTISPWAQISLPKAKNKGLDMSQPKKELTVAEIEDYFYKLGVISSKLGNITQERMAVILDRNHLL